MNVSETDIRLDWLSYRVGLWMREQRKRMRWSQEELASRMNVYRKRISHWETGGESGRNKMRRMTLEDFVTLCDLFACDPGTALLHILKEPRSTIKKENKMLIRDDTWLKIREQFSEGEKVVMRSSITADTADPKGVVVNENGIGPNLFQKIKVAIREAERS